MLADTARLVASLELKDNGFSKTADAASKKVDGLGRTVSRVGAIGKQGLANVGQNLKRIGVGIGAIGAVAVVASIKSGTDSLIELENATSQVDEAIRQMGQGGKISAAQIAGWANEIEHSVDAAFDDKDILAASENLIRFGNIAPSALRETLVVATDLAAAMGGDVNAASLKMAKALANPEKATRLLAATGVKLDKAEEKRLKRLNEAGKLHKAQALLIDLVRQKTDGAADGLNGKTADAMNNWNDALEDVNKAIATGFLPLMTDVANFVSEELMKPETIDRIQDFGTRLAGVGRAAFEFAKKIPWSAIGDGLSKAADFAGKLFDAFRSMPPEVQATLIALAGLDKLSGGAISGIVGELGKGLIKGVLGITAGVVNLRAASVVGGGGVPLGPGGAVGKTGRLGGLMGAAGTILKVSLVGIAAGVAVELWGEREKQAAANRQLTNDFTGNTKQFIAGASTADLKNAIKGIDDGLAALKNDLPAAIAYDLDIDGVRTATEGSRKLLMDAVTKADADAALIAFRDGERTSETGLYNTTNAARGAGVAAALASTNAGARVASAIAAKPMSTTVTTTVNVSVTPSGIQKETTTVTSQGNPNGSLGGGNNQGANRLNNGIA